MTEVLDEAKKKSIVTQAGASLGLQGTTLGILLLAAQFVLDYAKESRVESEQMRISIVSLEVKLEKVAQVADSVSTVNIRLTQAEQEIERLRRRVDILEECRRRPKSCRL